VITQYHPDKVTHLGLEFQELASIRAAELTTAYKVLTNSDARAEYDDGLAARGGTAVAAPAPPPTSPDHSISPESAPPPSNRGSGSRFAAVRAGKNDIVRRATLQRVHRALQQALGDCEFPALSGFDLACIPRGKAATSRLSGLLKKQVVPIVLVRIVAVVDGAAAMEAFGNVVRSRIDTKDKPIALLLIGNQLGPASELARAVEDARKKSPATQDRIFPVPIDARDWSAKLPHNTPDTIRTLVGHLKESL
jgi:curved DNA-binding protein CbpA